MRVLESQATNQLNKWSISLLTHPTIVQLAKQPNNHCIKGEGYSRNGVFLEIANKNITLR